MCSSDLFAQHAPLAREHGHSFAPQSPQLGLGEPEGTMERSLRTLAAAGLAVLLHLIGLAALVWIAPDLPRLAEAPIF